MIPKLTTDQFNEFSRGRLPEHLGVRVTQVSEGAVRAELTVTGFLLAPNGFLHAGTVVSLADTCAGYGCIAHLPDGANGFTTIELKSNHLATAREGVLECLATPVHLGRTTQVWDAVVVVKESGKKIALFRCTQLVIYPT